MQLRPYQTTVVEKLYKSHEVYDRVLLTLPTGSGKSVIAANITHNYPGYTCVIAHRREIVDQLADALDTPHQILAPGHDWNAPRVTVASVDTLLARRGRLGVWPDMVGLWLIDEAHHMQPGNRWGKAADMFRFARGVGLTATPRRLDGRALPFGELITGASTAELMSAGWLCGYRAFAPATVAGVESLPVGSSGEYQQDPMRRVLERSTIVGDVVAEYLRIAPGCLGLTFAVDTAAAEGIAAAYRVAGVPAAVVTAATPSSDRRRVVEQFRRRELLQLVNVDLFAEGVDVPALAVVSMARPTMSLALYLQQFGRVLRPMPGKKHGIVIDHVGNVLRHGLPDTPRTWSLEGVRSRSSATTTLRACASCTAVYERLRRDCPFCGYHPEPSSRSSIHAVDGDLLELTPAALASLRVRDLPEPRHLSPRAAAGYRKRVRERSQARTVLVNTINAWRASVDVSDSVAYRMFYQLFGVDVLTAQHGTGRELELLSARIRTATTDQGGG